MSTLLLTMVFGIVEFAFLMKDDVSLTSAVRQGGRIASANAGAGPGGVGEGGDCIIPCTPANAPKFAQLAANAVQQAGSAMPKDSIVEFWVYKADDKGYSAGTTIVSGKVHWNCSTNCVKLQVGRVKGPVPLQQRHLALQHGERVFQSPRRCPTD